MEPVSDSVPGQRLQLDTTGVGTYRLTLDGTDISNAVQAVDVSLKPGQLPGVTLHLRVFEVGAGELDHSQVVIPPETVEMLVGLGWTPPSDAAEHSSE
jgi:hypothetical protein